MQRAPTLFYGLITATLAAAWLVAIAQFSLGLTGEQVRLDALVAAFFLFGVLVGVEMYKRIWN
jgi:hypothetical protein